QMGVYPAIDVPSSVSRVMNDIVDAGQSEAARKFRRLVSLYLENRDLILMGGYTPGQDVDLDLAVRLWPQLMELIQQNGADKAGFGASRDALVGLMDS
ncbi:MAG: flagellum-specific ATP synthase FliI, partial [Pseudomonadota bacterium]|nr:flagellum-specific ATP synthase FliI [Pseudomonadota bacterium]